jgi:hypothetical protein
MDFFAKGALKDSPNSLLSRERVAGGRERGERERGERGREKTYDIVINHLAT